MTDKWMEYKSYIKTTTETQMKLKLKQHNDFNYKPSNKFENFFPCL